MKDAKNNNLTLQFSMRNFYRIWKSYLLSCTFWWYIYIVLCFLLKESEVKTV